MNTENIQFGEWKTPFYESDLQIIDLHWGDGSISTHIREGKSFNVKRNSLFKDIELQVHILDLNDGSLYQLNYTQVNGFRLLDEHGLLEIWEERQQQKLQILSTFKIKNHLWSKESPLTFIIGNPNEWSFMIATDWECLEVICPKPPSIKLMETLNSES